jgi:integration host factor subunit beta
MAGPRADPAMNAEESPSSTMTRSDLVAMLAERFGQLTQRDAEFAVKTVLDAMGDALARGHRIEIRGFGSFQVNRRPPRVGRNPRSGEQVIIPEKLVPHFKPGKALREAVDQLADDGREQHAAQVLGEVGMVSTPPAAARRSAAD